jgi:hypothetical protein
MRLNCAQCERLLYPKQRVCQCGWRRPLETLPPEERPRSTPAPAVARALAEMLAKVTTWIEKYRAKYPGASEREASIALMRKKGWLNLLPEVLKK